MLAGIDALVFDIQDVGVRFYTYESTMLYAMQEAAKAKIGFYVLDRPNPLGGVEIARQGECADLAERGQVAQQAVHLVLDLSSTRNDRGGVVREAHQRRGQGSAENGPLNCRRRCRRIAQHSLRRGGGVAEPVLKCPRRRRDALDNQQQCGLCHPAAQ